MSILTMKEVAEKKKLQLFPSKSFVLLNDKLKSKIFDLNEKDYSNREIIESKKPLILTTLKIHFSTEFKDKPYLTGYDQIIFDACISEQHHGNEFTTPAVIHRAIGGSKVKFTVAEQEKILNSVRKLASTFIDFDMSDVCEHFKYNEGKEFTYCGYLLPAELISATVNGQLSSAVIHFIQNSPLLDVALMKKQIISCDNNLLDIPGTNINENILAIKGCLLRRILSIKGSHNPKRGKRVSKLSPIILFDSIFEQCELLDADRNRKSEYRNAIAKILNHFKSCGIISDWHFEKKGNQFYSIHLKL